MLTIYGLHRSRAIRNYWLCDEMGIAYQKEPIWQAYKLKDPLAADAPVNTKSPAFLAINPNGHIPSISDDGLVLHESLAINLYLARKHGGPLAPADIAEEGQMLMWSFWAVTEIESHALKIMLTYMDGIRDTDGGREQVAASTRLLKAPLTVLDKALAATGYLVGGRFTVADINVSECTRYVEQEPGLLAPFPHVAAWLDKLHARPAFVKNWAIRNSDP